MPVCHPLIWSNVRSVILWMVKMVLSVTYAGTCTKRKGQNLPKNMWRDGLTFLWSIFSQTKLVAVVIQPLRSIQVKKGTNLGSMSLKRPMQGSLPLVFISTQSHKYFATPYLPHLPKTRIMIDLQQLVSPCATSWTQARYNGSNLFQGKAMEGWCSQLFVPYCILSWGIVPHMRPMLQSLWKWYACQQQPRLCDQTLGISLSTQNPQNSRAQDEGLERIRTRIWY